MRPPHYSILPAPFWDKVTPDENGCWLWTAVKNSEGYGIYSEDHIAQRAHRMSAEDFYGKIPMGLQVNHHCDIPSCVLPIHLYIGTQTENLNDSYERKTRLIRGQISSEEAAFIKKYSGTGLKDTEITFLFL